MNRHTSAIRRERQHDDPAIPMGETSNRGSASPFDGVQIWYAWDPGQTDILAEDDIELLRLKGNL